MNEMKQAAIAAILILCATSAGANVACTKAAGVHPDTWGCVESVRNESINYGWTLSPPWLGTFRAASFSGANYNYDRLMICDTFEQDFFDDVPLPDRIDGLVSVTRQFGIDTGPLSQRVSYASVYCDTDNPSPVQNASRGGGVGWLFGIGGWDPQPVDEPICGGGPMTIYTGINSIVIVCH